MRVFRSCALFVFQGGNGKGQVYVDFLTLACLRDHLDTLLGGRVQQVVLPDDRSVGLELYARERLYLLASAHPQYLRMLLVPEKPRRGVETATLLLLLLRKWVRNARLVDVSQPAWERILMLHFDGPAGLCRLVVELAGRYSNVVLVGPDGRVLEAVKHVGPEINRYRVTLPAQPYQLPPLPPGRRPPLGMRVDEWAGRLGSAAPDEPLHRWLVGQFLGVSPLAAREIAARATRDPEARVRAAAPEAVARAVAELFAPLEEGWWAPHVALDDAGTVIAFAPYRPQQFEQVEPVADISQAMWRYFAERQLADSYAAARQAVTTLLDKARARLKRRLAHLQSQQVDESELNDFRMAGELLLTFQGQVPGGAREVTLTDYEGAPRTITLDPHLTAVENAQAYFRRYGKARRAAKQVPALIADLDADRAYVEQLAADLALAESRPEIDAVRDALVEAGWARRGRSRAGKVDEPRRFDVDGFPVYVGRNARQNEQLTFQRAGPDDLWLHVRGLPGAHVIIKCDRRAVPEGVVRHAAELAAYYSPAREEGGRVPVDVTQRRFVRRLRGGHPGLVTYRQERTVWVERGN
jgi:predicted ribosome quality control (RQC) complex YloA/Tae2 family protein